MLQYIFFITILTFFFIIYVESTVGNILFRINSDGFKSINCRSMLNFLFHPLHNTFLWNYKSLDINYPFIVFISSIFYINLK